MAIQQTSQFHVRSQGDLICDVIDCLVSPWCEHLRDYIKDGKDAELLHPDMTINVPMWPTMSVYAKIELASSAEFPRAAMMILEVTPDYGKPFLARLGFWNPGDGCRVIRSVILDWVMAQCHPHEKWSGKLKTSCPSAVHGFREQNQMQALADKSPAFKAQCLWDIVTEKACTVCRDMSGDINDSIPRL